MGIRGRFSYSNVVATVALFLALGGGAYAAVELSKNSVGSKQIRKSAVRSGEVKNRSLKPGDLNSGAVAAFAYIRFDGPSTLEVEYGRGVTGVESAGGAGEYGVSFNRDVANCVAHANPGIGKPRGGTAGTVDVELQSTAGILIDPDPKTGAKDRVVAVAFRSDAGAPVNTSFMITLIC